MATHGTNAEDDYFLLMSAKELRPKLDPETCSICGRRLLQGEQVNWYVAPDSTRRAVCELCIPRAERVRWVREREGEEIVQLQASHHQRPGLMRRLAVFFGAGEPTEEEGFAHSSGRPEQDLPKRGRHPRSVRRADGLPEVDLESRPRDIAAVPTGPRARLERGLELFNHSQFPRTIAGLSRSLGDPKVAAVNAASGAAVDVWVGWDLAWYSYRIELTDPTEPVEQSGRGNDIDELLAVVSDWNAGADGYGRLFLTGEPERSDQPVKEDSPS
jgi:predicted Fe-S protein YdhL (DUF1289 family)